MGAPISVVLEGRLVAPGRVPSGRVPKYCDESLPPAPEPLAPAAPADDGKFSWPEADQAADGDDGDCGASGLGYDDGYSLVPTPGQ